MNENTTSTQEDGLVVGVRRIAAARTRTDVPSDNTGGKSDMNDS
ncbi:hypothetical protein [Streptomyces sp. NPDC006012]